MARHLTQAEKAVITWMIDHGYTIDEVTIDKAHLHNQLDTLRAIDLCDCGACINLALSNGTTPIGRQRVTLNAHGPNDCLIILFIDDGAITELEIAPASDDLPVRSIPSPSDLVASQFEIPEI